MQCQEISTTLNFEIKYLQDRVAWDRQGILFLFK